MIEEQINDLLKNSHVTQDALAKRFGMSQPAINRVIRSDKMTPLLAILNLTGSKLQIVCKDGKVIDFQNVINQTTQISKTSPDDKRKKFGSVRDKMLAAENK